MVENVLEIEDTLIEGKLQGDWVGGRLDDLNVVACINLTAVRAESLQAVEESERAGAFCQVPSQEVIDKAEISGESVDTLLISTLLFTVIYSLALVV